MNICVCIDPLCCLPVTNTLCQLYSKKIISKQKLQDIKIILTAKNADKEDILPD